MFQNTKKGFTLIELLVVIAIIAILAAILFPVFAQAREKARASACLSNTKQIGTAFQLYVDDYDETFPGNWQEHQLSNSNETERSSNWTAGRSACNALRPYLKNEGIWCCPSAVPTKNTELWKNGVAPTKNDPTYFACSYHFNGNIIGKVAWNFGNGGGFQFPSATLTQIGRPSQIAVVYDGPDYSFRSMFVPYYNDSYNATYLNHQTLVPKMHNDGMNLTFCDGHAKYMKSDAIEVGTFGANWSGDRTRKAKDWDGDNWLTHDIGE